MRIDVLTLFPEMFPGYLGQSLLKRAIDAGLVDIQLHDIRDWARGKHQQVDDRPFGGGPGMVLQARAGGRMRRSGASCRPSRPATWCTSRRKAEN